jgi:PhnB protein
MNNTTVTPYLYFSGRCEEALEFYRTAISAEILMMMRFSESPMPPAPGTLQTGFEEKIMHASFKVGCMTLMASDSCDDKSRFEGFRLVLTVSTEAEAHQAFNGLSDGGTVQLPLQKTFWSPCYGIVTDKFDVGWMVMMAGDPQ